MLVREYCPHCDSYVDVIPVTKIGVIEWICNRCGQTIDEDYEQDWYDYDR